MNWNVTNVGVKLFGGYRSNVKNYQQQKTMMMLSQSPNFTTTTSDDGMTTTSPTESGINNSLISKFIMNHMLSDDCETME